MKRKKPGRPASPDRAKAQREGRTTYQGRPCPKGHDGRRYVSTFNCVQCVADNRDAGRQREKVTMKPKAKEYRNGWSTSMDKAGAFYVVMVRNGRGDVHDKMRCDDYRDALDYWRAFNAIAKGA